MSLNNKQTKGESQKEEIRKYFGMHETKAQCKKICEIELKQHLELNL